MKVGHGVLLVGLSIGVLAGATSASAATAPPAPTVKPAIATTEYGGVALHSDGTVWAWGDNSEGSVGDGTKTDRMTPVRVRGPVGQGYLTHIVALAEHGAAALRADGTVWTWGTNHWGEVGDGTTTDRVRATQVVGPGGQGHLSNIVSLASTGTSNFAVDSDGRVWAWGANLECELGIGSTSSDHFGIPTPTAVVGPDLVTQLRNVKQLSASGEGVLALLADGTVWGWGLNSVPSQIKDTMYCAPVQARYSVGGLGTPITGATELSEGVDNALVRLSNGTVLAWGDNTYGQILDGTTQRAYFPAVISGLPAELKQVVAGHGRLVVVTDHGHVLGWGDNSYNRLAIAAPRTITRPMTVGNLTSGMSSVVLGFDQGFALTQKGLVRAWGDGLPLALGTDSYTGPPLPITVQTAGVGLPRLFLTSAPTVRGSRLVGHPLVVTSGQWGLPATSVTYQWLRDGKVIAGAVYAKHNLSANDRNHALSVRVSAHRTGYPAGYYRTPEMKIS